ncbi:MAG: DUF177 domain-containing protein [Methylophilaceae bacterium]
MINNLEIAKSRETISGQIQLSECKRLIELLVKNSVKEQSVSYSLEGMMKKFHLPSLYLAINTTMPVICQRCLIEMKLDLSLTFDYVVSEAEPEAFDGNEDADWLEKSREMDLNALIEDELLMAIPLAPTHSHDCKPTQTESGEKHNPFAVLKKLKGKS